MLDFDSEGEGAADFQVKSDKIGLNWTNRVQKDWNMSRLNEAGKLKLKWTSCVLYGFELSV